MPRAKDTAAYPQVFLDIATALSEDRTLRFEVKYEDRAAAMSARLDFYAFKQAAIREGLAGETSWPEIKAFYMEVREDGTATIMHRDHSPTALKLREAYDKVMIERKLK